MRAWRGRVVEHVKGLEAEVNVLKHLDHPNIVRYLVRAPGILRAAWCTQLPGAAGSNGIEGCGCNFSEPSCLGSYCKWSSRAFEFY